MTTRLLTLRDVTAMTALSPLGRLRADRPSPASPKPIRIGSRVVPWVTIARSSAPVAALR